MESKVILLLGGVLLLVGLLLPKPKGNAWMVYRHNNLVIKVDSMDSEGIVVKNLDATEKNKIKCGYCGTVLFESLEEAKDGK